MTMRSRSAALALLAVSALITSKQMPRASAAAASPTFYRDVLPVLQQDCQSCHRPGQIAPMPLITYDQTQPFASAIAGDADSRKMPPWFADPSVGHFSNDLSLSSQEIGTLVAWAAANAPAGNPSDAPPPRQWTEGWNIPPPDLVIRMPKPVAIPALCTVEYTYEIVPTGFTEGKWVQMSEIRPSSRENVHHAVVYIRPPDSPWLRHALDRRAVHGVRYDGRGRSPRHAHDEGGHSARLCAGKFAGQLAGRNGEVHPGGFGPRLPDALHDARPRGQPIRPASASSSPSSRPTQRVLTLQLDERAAS